MERKRKFDNSGLYTAICCFAVVLAVVGFASSKGNKKKQEPERVQYTEHTETKIAKTEPEKYATKTPEKSETKEVVKKTIVKEEATFERPVSGKIISEFSNEELIYNEALRDWRTHSGIDLEAQNGEQVLSAANGIVEKVFDSNMGKSIIIDHQNGYKTVYSNLAEDLTLKQGDEVAEGDVIGTIGNTALGDATDIPHLHFEIIEKGKNIDPANFLE